MPMPDPKWLKVTSPEQEYTVCSWCGVLVPTALQQQIHTQWHRALGVVPLAVRKSEQVPE